MGVTDTQRFSEVVGVRNSPQCRGGKGRRFGWIEIVNRLVPLTLGTEYFLIKRENSKREPTATEPLVVCRVARPSSLVPLL